MRSASRSPGSRFVDSPKTGKGPDSAPAPLYVLNAPLGHYVRQPGCALERDDPCRSESVSLLVPPGTLRGSSLAYGRNPPPFLFVRHLPVINDRQLFAGKIPASVLQSCNLGASALDPRHCFQVCSLTYLHQRIQLISRAIHTGFPLFVVWV